MSLPASQVSPSCYGKAVLECRKGSLKVAVDGTDLGSGGAGCSMHRSSPSTLFLIPSSVKLHSSRTRRHLYVYSISCGWMRGGTGPKRTQSPSSCDSLSTLTFFKSCQPSLSHHLFVFCISLPRCLILSTSYKFLSAHQTC